MNLVGASGENPAFLKNKMGPLGPIVSSARISRVLCSLAGVVTIHLRADLHQASSCQPGLSSAFPRRTQAASLGVPIRYCTLRQVTFEAMLPSPLARLIAESGGGLLPHLFTRSCLRRWFFSVALLVWLERPARIFSGRWLGGARTFLERVTLAVTPCRGVIGNALEMGKGVQGFAWEFLG